MTTTVRSGIPGKQTIKPNVVNIITDLSTAASNHPPQQHPPRPNNYYNNNNYNNSQPTQTSYESNARPTAPIIRNTIKPKLTPVDNSFSLGDFPNNAISQTDAEQAIAAADLEGQAKSNLLIMIAKGDPKMIEDLHGVGTPAA